MSVSVSVFSKYLETYKRDKFKRPQTSLDQPSLITQEIEMQWLGTTRPPLWVCFLPKLNFLPLLYVPPQVSILVKETPTWGHYSVFLLDPTVTVKTKKDCPILNHVRNHTGSIVKTIFAAIAREVFVCFVLFVIIMDESNMKVFTVCSSTPTFHPPFTDLGMSVFTSIFFTFPSLKIWFADLL